MTLNVVNTPSASSTNVNAEQDTENPMDSVSLLKVCFRDF